MTATTACRAWATTTSSTAVSGFDRAVYTDATGGITVDPPRET